MHSNKKGGGGGLSTFHLFDFTNLIRLFQSFQRKDHAINFSDTIQKVLKNEYCQRVEE